VSPAGQIGRLDEGPWHELAEGVRASALFGEGAMLNLLDFEPGSRVERHSHPHEQLGMVLEGELVLEVGGIPHRLGPGGCWQIPGGVVHSAWTEPGQRCRALDVFQPVREDYRERFRG
jgi:quercetin dioxygenase-like cupin family protein